MSHPKPLLFLKRRLSNRPDPEHIQMAIRIAIVTTAMLYFHSDYFADGMQDAEYLLLARWSVSIAFAVTIGLFVALLINPGVSVVRRIIGIVHDVGAISIGMFLGQAGAAAVAAIYLWVTLGNGFRFGTRYLYISAALSIVGFGCVYIFSDYWRLQSTLSVNILILLVAIPPYVAGLLNSLHRAKELLRLQATVDGLTGLMNRSELEQSVESILDLKHNGHFLLFCDLDHFKNVNDAAGHAAGDKLLADIGTIIRELVRGDDLTARLGGDEFCVFLKNCPLEKARNIAENICDSLSKYRLAWGTDYYTVGISIGVAPSSAVKDMGSLFRLADAACYAAKNAGRNRVHVIDPQTELTDTQEIRKPPSDDSAQELTT